jgi:photosystem II stability/assembly factor-like uncharacterized protein
MAVAFAEKPAVVRRQVTGNPMILAGTEHGLFLYLCADHQRTEWEGTGPFLAPFDVHHASLDPRDGSIWAAANGDGARIYRSIDFGGSWEAMGDPLPCDLVWHVEPGRTDEPDVVYAGVMPAALYRSGDGGRSWQLVEGLTNHPSRGEWWPGGGGLCLHTILLPPDRPGRIYVAISVAGVFRSDDDGATWQAMNDGLPGFIDDFRSEIGADPTYPEVHRCVHNLVCHPENPDVLFQQNHLGVFRSDDAGRSWRSINSGLPSNFGFPIAIGAGPTPAIFVVPQDEELLRTRDHLAVWRSKDGGGTWSETASGLPAGEHNVLREGMAADRFTPTGIYFGTTRGLLFASADGGESWQTVAEGLPRIRSVEAGLVP